MKYNPKTDRWEYEGELDRVLQELHGRNGQWALTSYALADGDPQSTIKGGMLIAGALLLSLIGRTLG